MFERAGKHAFADMWMGGVRSAVYGGDMSPVGDMISGALSSIGNGYINDGVDNIVLKIVSSAVLGGTISEIGGGKFANGAVTGAYSMLFNHLMHHVLFADKTRAYRNMIRQSKSGKHEVAAVELDDGKILVFRENGNMYRSSQNYFVDKEGDDKTYVRINGKLFQAIHQIHTHPGYYSSDMSNPLNVSSADTAVSERFGGEIRILMIESKTLYSVWTRGNGLAYPQVKWQDK